MNTQENPVFVSVISLEITSAFFLNSLLFIQDVFPKHNNSFQILP